MDRQPARVSAQEDGQTMAEYGIVLGVITIGVVTAVAAFSGAIVAAVDRVVSLMP